MSDETDWDEDLLSEELIDLEGMGFSLGLTGFDSIELDRLTADDEEIERAEAAPPLPAIPICQPGDVWLLGSHRLVCGDALDPAAVAAVLDGKAPHLLEPTRLMA